MLTDARFEARHQIADLAPHLTLDPVGMNGTISEESRCREPIEGQGTASAASDIVLSRWTATHGGERTECSVTPDDYHIVALSLRTTRMSLSTQSKRLFERSLPPGTILVSAPGQRLEMRVTPPFDFLHFHVANRLLRDEGLAVDQDDFVPCELSPFRDTLAEALGRSLLEENVHRSQPEYARVVAKAIVMRAIGRQQAKRRCWALPKWRMKRLEQYIALNIDRAISLGDMAATVGLSKMHFAAQFRALTGFRPREYLLFKRIERAKAVMTETGMPLVEVAFAAGFNAQAHFSTVFKRFTGKTPAQWRQECRHAI